MKAQPTIEVGLSISCDTHYLTICLDKIEPTLELLARTFGKGDKDFRIARRTFVGWSRPYEKIRDALEHVNERMAKGLPVEGTVKDGSYTFVGPTVRIDQTARRELNEFTEELLAKMEKLLGVVTS